jgi:hypothetical protein
MTKPVFKTLECAASSPYAYSAERFTPDLGLTVRAGRLTGKVYVNVTRSDPAHGGLSISIDLPADVAQALADALQAACKARGATA